MDGRRARALRAHRRSRQVRHGGLLIRKGEPGQAFLILITGEAEVTQGGKSLRRLYPGDDAALVPADAAPRLVSPGRDELVVLVGTR
jgi:hypothetical protein